MSSCEVDIIQHVLRNRNNYYRILMVDRNASSSDIKSAYRKMALRCHPDKCTHAHAAEAFKLVGTAYTTLSDATKRRVYDAQGADGVQRHESRGMRRPNANGAAAAGGRGGHANARHNDFFQEFFFGNGNQFFTTGPNVRTHGFQFTGDDGFERMELSGSWMMLLPILLFLLLALLLQSSVTDFAFAQGGSGGSSGSVSSGGSGSLGSARVGADTSGGRGNAQGRAQRRSFALVPEPDQGIIFERVTSLYGLRVKYYVTQQWMDVLRRRRDVLINTEKEILRSQKDYLGSRCQSETLKHQKRGVPTTPASCREYERFTQVLR